MPYVLIYSLAFKMERFKYIEISSSA